MNIDSVVKTKEKDLLERYPFAEGLIKGLLVNFENGQDSLVIGLIGEWGCGKSSVLEFLKQEISNQTKAEPFRNLIYEFNPWRFSNQDDLQKQFLKELGIILGSYNNEFEKIKRGTRKFSTFISKANKANKEPISNISIGLISDLFLNFTEEKSLMELKNQVDERLADDKIKLFIFIDDIDRLTPKEITDIFQLIKLNANFKNTYFIIAFDKNIVINALTNQYGSSGENYIEKIVQVDYSIPKINKEVIQNIFAEELQKIIIKLNLKIKLESIGQLWDNYLKNLFTTIRQVYRYCNALELRLPSIYNEIDIDQFLILEAIRIFDYKTYEWIYKNSDILTYARINPFIFNFSSVSKPVELNKEAVDLINNSQDLKQFIKIERKILIDLFSIKSTAKGYESIKDELNKVKSIISADYFDHYFSFKISSQNISDIIYVKFLNGSIEDKTIILNEYRDKNLFHKFIKGLLFKIQREKVKKDEIFDEFLNYIDNNLINFISEFFNQGGGFVVFSLLNEVVNEYKRNEGYEIFLKSVLKDNIYSYSRYQLISSFYHNLYDAGYTDQLTFFPKEILMGNQSIITDRIYAYLKYFGEDFKVRTKDFDDYTIGDILKNILKMDEKLYSDVIDKIMLDDEYILILFRLSLSQLQSTSFLGIAYTISNDEYIMPQLTIEKFSEKLGTIKQMEYIGRNKEYLDLYYNLKIENFKSGIYYTLAGERKIPGEFRL